MRRLFLLGGTGLAAIVMACSSGGNSSSPTSTGQHSDEYDFICNDMSNPDDISQNIIDTKSEFITNFQGYEGFSEENFSNLREKGQRLPAGNAYRDEDLHGDLYGLNMLFVHLPSKTVDIVTSYFGTIDALCFREDNIPYVLVNLPDDLLSQKIIQYSPKSAPLFGKIQVQTSGPRMYPINNKTIAESPVTIDELMESINKIPDSDYAKKFKEVPNWHVEIKGINFEIESGLAYSLHPLFNQDGDTDPSHYVIVSVPFSIDASSEHNSPIFNSVQDPSTITRYPAGSSLSSVPQ
ncbi:MAG: hypothetical protein AABX51_00470 [Nanoarchaeota archaeon]